jgi:DNA repair exonuclease SbcCD nuclease subunit
MTDSVRILHCADLHLGAAHISLGARSRTRRTEFRNTFHRITELAKKEEVNLLLVAGDLFDLPVVPEDICVEVRDAFAALSPLRVALCSGNHDPAVSDSVYLREDFWPDNVTIFSSGMRVEEFPEIGIRLVGAGFTGAYSPHTQLRRMVLPEDGLINIGLMHGTIVSEGQGSDHNPITIRQIENSGLDYLALGHIHTRKAPARAGKTTYAYSGCTEGRKFGENGQKGVYIADVSHNGCDVRFVPVCERRLEYEEFDITGLNGNGEIAEELRELLTKTVGPDYREQIIRVTLTGEAESGVLSTEAVEVLLSDIWFLDLIDDTTPVIDRNELEMGNTLKALFIKKLEERAGEVPEKRIELAKKLCLKAFAGKLL